MICICEACGCGRVFKDADGKHLCADGMKPTKEQLVEIFKKLTEPMIVQNRSKNQDGKG